MRPGAHPFLWKCMDFICMTMKNHFHIKGEVFNLVLIQRPGGTKKWPIFMKGSFGNKVQDKKQGRKIKPLADPGEGPGGPGPSPFLSQGLDDMRYVMINILPQQCFFKTLTTSMRSILTRVRTKSLIVRPGQTWTMNCIRFLDGLGYSLVVKDILSQASLEISNFEAKWRQFFLPGVSLSNKTVTFSSRSRSSSRVSTVSFSSWMGENEMKVIGFF